MQIPKIRTKSLAFRLVAGAAVWIAAALLAGGIALSLVFRDYVERAFDARLVVLLDALVAGVSVADDGRLALSRGPSEPRFDQPYSGWYWQVATDAGPQLRSRSLWDQVLSPDYRLVGGAGYRFQMLAPRRQRLRFVARDVTLPGSSRTYHFVVSGDESEIQADIRAFDRTLAWSLGALGLGLIIAVLIQVRYGLLPMRRIRAALADVSSGRSDRMEGEFPAEVEPLVDEINILLENNAAIVERARTHVGNLAHALNTPLSVLTNAISGAKPPGPGALAETVRRQIEIMRRNVDHYLARARTAASVSVLGARTEVLPVIEDLSRTLARIHSAREIEIGVDVPEGLYFKGERHDFEEMLGNLIDNACKWAAARVEVSAEAGDARLRVCVDDDGPGLSVEESEAAFGRGRRLDEAVPGSGLGLSIVRDIADLYDGAVALEQSDAGGLRAMLDLPAAEVLPRERRV
jgi:signal transduction histidine kinase